MDKNIFFIIFLLLFLISIFFIYKLNLCRKNYIKLSNILKRNSEETVHLLNKVITLKGKKKNLFSNKVINYNLTNNLDSDLSVDTNELFTCKESESESSIISTSDDNCPACPNSNISCEECLPCLDKNYKDNCSCPPINECSTSED